MPCILDKDELYNYYIVEGHSRAETLEHFDVTLGILKSNLSRYGIRKDGADSRFEQYENIKEELLDFYITQNKTLLEASEKFGINKQLLIKLLNFWGVNKDRHNSALNSRKAYHENFIKAIPSKEEVYQYYVVEDHTRAECIEHWCTSRKVFGKWLNILGIKKAEPLPYISREAFYDYYIVQNHKQEECAEHFDVTVNQILTYTHKYKIYKSPELVGKFTIENNKQRWASYTDEQRQSIADKIADTLINKPEEEKQAIMETINQTKRENNTFSTSMQEDKFYEQLLQIFNQEDICRQYNSERYPFNCDFYIRPLDLFIELNLFSSHGKEPFNAAKESHQKRLKQLHERLALGKEMYKDMIEVWTIRDPLKFKVAAENKLNYVVLYNNKEIEKYLTQLRQLVA
jgi:transposase